MNIILIALGIILIIINFRALSKEKSNTFSNIFKDQEHKTKDYDLELMAIRKDMAESILDIQQEMNEIKKEINYIKDIKNSEKVVDILIDNNIDKNINNIDENDKVTIIRDMILNGCNDDEICSKVKVGKGEVLLIRSLFK